MGRTNWAGNLTYGAERLVVPDTVGDVQAAVAAATKVRAVGSRHCFNDIADTTGTQVSLEKLRGVVAIDAGAGRVTVEGGIRYSDLGPRLHAEGLSLHNLASLPHITIAGACATATHGSGMRLGNLATAVSAIEFANAEGNLVSLSRAADPDVFPGAVVSLGALGVITKLTLKAEPAFEMRQHLFTGLPMDALEANLEAVMACGYSVSLFTTWLGEAVEQVWVKSRTDRPSGAAGLLEALGTTAATETLHPATGRIGTEHCSIQMGVVGPAYDRLPHFRIEAIPAVAGDHQAEYFVPVERAAEAVRAVRAVAPRLASTLLVSEVRIIAADDLWLSPFYGRPRVGFHFSFGTNWSAMMDVLPELEAALAPFDPVPHWGKLFTMPPGRFQGAYPRLGDFRDLLAAHDPKGKFRNAFVERNIFGQA